MHIINLYKGLGDEVRLRVLNLLSDGPLCVCHLMEILDRDQIKISKQLRYLKQLGLVECERQAQWMVYRIADSGDVVLKQNLKILRKGFGEELCVAEDLRKRVRILERLKEEGAACSKTLLAGQQRGSGMKKKKSTGKKNK